MPEGENHVLSGATNDIWRTWLMTGVRRAPADRRRMRGAHKGLKKMLLEGMSNGEDRPHAWKDFSGAMIRHAVDEAIGSLPQEDKQVVKLAYFGGYSNREIASQVGLTEGTVQRRLRRALSAISEHIQHGRALGRRAANALMIGLCARWLHDTAHQLVQVAAVAGAAAIIVAQPALTSAPASPRSYPDQSRAGAAGPVVPPIPSPTIPASIRAGSAPVTLPQVSPPAVTLPVDVPALPPLPIKVKSLV
jgi:predicted DNA-binding protein (UPF0251 family)